MSKLDRVRNTATMCYRYSEEQAGEVEDRNGGDECGEVQPRRF